MCTFCVFKAYHWDQLDRKAALSRQISHHMLVSTLCDFRSLHLNASHSVALPSLFFSSVLHQQQCQYLLLCLCSADEHQTFATNPSLYVSPFPSLFPYTCLSRKHCKVWSVLIISAWHPQLEDYSTVLKTPMWLGNVADKLQRQLYQTVGEFVSDVQLIFTNCATYNRVRDSVIENF